MTSKIPIEKEREGMQFVISKENISELLTNLNEVESATPDEIP